ncbi:MAG TPA: glycosyltransferase [Chitinophagales bacterium]|nr:glycosyltransferase [Chitinophagales bacterium]
MLAITFFVPAMPVELKIFIACIAIQVLYYAVVFFRLNFVRPFSSMPEMVPPVSVVICARNEAPALLRNLKIVLIQQFKQFEVVVVNDQSTDNTAEVLVDYYKRNSNLKVVNIPAGINKPLAGKKYALMQGIEAATYDTIVVTDADCRPATTLWLAKLVGAYMHGSQIVLGFSPFEKHPGFLNKLIRYENFITALQYFGFAKLGIPYMGVGRNLSYKKELFKGFKGFEKKPKLLTGDDDLFVNTVATGRNTEVCIDKDTFVYTRPELTWGAWLNQKRRHLRSSFSYKFIHQLLLFIFAASNFAVYVLLTWLCVKVIALKWVLGLFFGLILVKLLITFRVYKKLGAADLRFLSPALDVCYSVYLLLIFLLLLLKPKDSWKT